MKKWLSSILAMSLIAALFLPIVPVQAADPLPIEIASLRGENSKTYDLGNGKRSLEVSMGAIHYKDNYANPSEQWKDIDLTWLNNRIDKAPYILVRDGNKITVTDKKTGDISTIELTSIKPAGLAFEIVPETTRVSFRHTLPSDKVPFEASFKVTGKNITTKAFDDDGELMLDTSLVGDVLTEKMADVKDKQTGQIRPAKGQIRVDPTWQVAASTDDCRRIYSNDDFSLTATAFIAGRWTATLLNTGSAARFPDVNIPAGATITSANLILTANGSWANDTVNTRLRAELNVAPVTFSDITDFDARTWTSDATHVHWNAIAAWTSDVEYTSPDLTAVIQEVADLGAVTHLVVLWDDWENLSTAVDNTRRVARSYDDTTTKAPKLVVTYTEPAAPTVTTQAVSSIGTTTAVGSGNITDTGGDNATARGVQWGTTTGVYTSNATETDNFGTGAFTSNITGLTTNPATTYYVRAFATNTQGTGYGSEVSFTTLGVGAVTTNAASGVTMDKDGVTGGSFNGTLSNTGNPTGHVLFEYGLTVAYGTNTTAVAKGTTGVFTAAIPTNLTPGATYHYRASANNTQGTVVGSDATFTFTMPTMATPTVTDLNLLNVTSATLNGNMSSLGASTGAYIYFQYGDDTSYGTDTAEQTKTTTGAYTASITEFPYNDTLHTRSVARVGSVYAYSADASTAVSAHLSTYTGTLPTLYIIPLIIFIALLAAGGIITLGGVRKVKADTSDGGGMLLIGVGLIFVAVAIIMFTIVFDMIKSLANS